MPNLRLIIPLMYKGIKDWVIEDYAANWREVETHYLDLCFPFNKLRVGVHGLKHFLINEGEE